MASADKPFRFPATFTFVVRSFTVLDGIGKGLDPRFDISEIAAPYARGLLLEGNPQYAALAKDFRRRVGLQVPCWWSSDYHVAMFPIMSLFQQKPSMLLGSAETPSPNR